MSGLAGYIGTRPAAPVVIETLTALEYRGYDSAGVAVLDGGRLAAKKTVGRPAGLTPLVSADPAFRSSVMGIGHTRWASHGRPTALNAHPVISGRVAVVHNGIVRNHESLRMELKRAGREFFTETDTECIAALLDSRLQTGEDPVEAIRHTLGAIEGQSSFCFIAEYLPETVYAVQNGHPLAIGLGTGEYFIASDVAGFSAGAQDYIVMEPGEIAAVSAEGARFRDSGGNIIDKKTEKRVWNAVMTEKGAYKHYFIKEVFEQPRAIRDTLSRKISGGEAVLEHVQLSRGVIGSLRKVVLVSCGTGWHAALIGKLAIESLSGLEVEVYLASEYRNMQYHIPRGSLFVGISQSGETGDTLAAIRWAKVNGAVTIGITNNPASSIARITDGYIPLKAGPEISVASTKTFTSTIAGLYVLGLFLGQMRDTIPPARAAECVAELSALPEKVEETLMLDTEIERLADRYAGANDFIFLGRWWNYPVALEAALKMKEIVYIHGEGLPAGEIKHGPITLIDEQTPVLFFAGQKSQQDQLLVDLSEIRTRSANVAAVAPKGDKRFAADVILPVPLTDDYLSPIINIIPAQLLAYHLGVIRRREIDLPRNVAKSITV